MMDILTNTGEISFGTFMATFPTLDVAAPSVVAELVDAAPATISVLNLIENTHPPKPYDLIGGWSESSR